jgi:WD40 repeat protein
MSTETVDTLDNPFPGLRPFQSNESHLFFGREGLSDELLDRLSETRFLAVVGTSGSGKSSLVRAGLLPALRGGSMIKAGSEWRVAILRPGNNPIGELARALNESSALGTTIEENEETQRIIIESTLRRGSLGLVEIVRQAELPKEENLLIVVDQFEELFRFTRKPLKSLLLGNSHKDAQSSASESQPGSQFGEKSDSLSNGNGLRPTSAEKYGNEASDFVQQLLESTRQDKVPIYVVITMRSDYLGDCAQFWGLPEAINQGQYLIPRMTREQQREAITGPIKVFGAEITPRLVTQLLNDIGDDPDQLPLLQHALMRTWKKAQVDSDNKKVLDLKHYLVVGGISHALSKHAEDTYEYLTEEQRKIAENLFKCLTIKGPEGQEIRRPTTLKDICEIIKEKEADVIKVIENFRIQGRSFLMPPVSEPLTAESQIDISHESLIRCWERLRRWVDEEAESARRYRRLADSAVLYKAKRTGLLRDPEAHYDLEWYDYNSPNEAWAKRYHDADFKIIKDFLEESRQQRNKELEDKEKQRRKVIRRKFTRILTATFIVAFLVISIASIAFFLQRNEANQQRNTAEHRSYAAQLAVAQISYEQGDYAAANKKLNWLRSYIEIDLKKNLNDFAGFEWYYLWKLSHNERVTTLNGHSERPVYAVAFSHDGRRIATGGGDGIVKLWDAGDKRALMPDLPVSPASAIRSIIFSPIDEKLLATESADGSVRLWDLSTNKERDLLQPPNRYGNMASVVAFSPDGKMLAAGGTTLNDKGVVIGKVCLWHVESGQKFIDRAVHTDSAYPDRSVFARSIAFSPGDGKVLAIGTDDGVELWSTNTGEELTKKIAQEPIILPGVSVYSVAFFPANKNILAIGSANSKVRLLDMSTSKKIDLQAHSKEVSSVVFSDDGSKLATGSYDGSVRVWDTAGGLEQIKEWTIVKKDNDDFLSLTTNPQDQFLSLKPTLKGHSGYVNSIAFSPDGETLISGSDDGTAKIWSTKTLYHAEGPELGGLKLLLGRPRLKEQKNAILSVAFSPYGEKLVSGSANKNLNLLSIKDLMTERKEQDDRDPGKLAELVEKYSKPKPYPGEVSSVAVSGKGKNMLAAGNWNGSVSLWDLSRGEELKDGELQSANSEGRVLSVSFSSDENMLAVGNDREEVKVWQLEPRRLLAPIKWKGSYVAFSPANGNLLAIGGAGNTVKLWNVRTGELLNLKALSGQGHTKRVSSVLFSPDGKMLATGSDDSTVILWNVDTREQMVTLKGHSNAISSLAFSSKSDRLATGSYDGSVKLWDTSRQIWGASPPLELTTLYASNYVITLAFSPDDRTLVAGGGDGYLWLWRAAAKDDVMKSNQN